MAQRRGHDVAHPAHPRGIRTAGGARRLADLVLYGDDSLDLHPVSRTGEPGSVSRFARPAVRRGAPFGAGVGAASAGGLDAKRPDRADRSRHYRGRGAGAGGLYVAEDLPDAVLPGHLGGQPRPAAGL